jgi:hypothetical protein
LSRTEWMLVAAGLLGFGVAALRHLLGVRWLTGAGILLTGVALWREGPKRTTRKGAMPVMIETGRLVFRRLPPLYCRDQRQSRRIGTLPLRSAPGVPRWG